MWQIKKRCVRQAFKNLETVLLAEGSRSDLVANTSILVSDITNFVELNCLFAEFFLQIHPPVWCRFLPLARD